jgi:hypothetical protein
MTVVTAVDVITIATTNFNNMALPICCSIFPSCISSHAVHSIMSNKCQFPVVVNSCIIQDDTKRLVSRNMSKPSPWAVIAHPSREVRLSVTKVPRMVLI